MRNRRLKKRKNTIKIVFRMFILTAIVCIIVYICYGVYEENKIRLVDEATPRLEIQRTVETKESTPKEKVNISERYLGFPVIAKLIIPKINLETYVLRDYTTEGMEVCISKYWGPEPNEVGNFCIAGHNYEKDNMFHHLIDLEIGDELYLLDNEHGRFSYTIYDIYKVKPQNTAPLEQKMGGKRVVTLITCVNYSRNRLIVQAVEN